MPSIFQTSNATASNINVRLEGNAPFQLSLVRRKVVTGRYLCDPLVR